MASQSVVPADLAPNESTPRDVLNRPSPIDGQPLEPVTPVASEQLADMVAQVRQAQPAWGRLTVAARAKILRKAARRMLDDRATVLHLMRREMGKCEVDGLMSEALGPMDQVNEWTKVVTSTLQPHRVRLNPLAFPKKRASWKREPRGVIGIIAPWNYPLATMFRSVLPSLLSGNAVVLKPSEYTPRVAAWFVRHIQDVLPTPVLQIAQGDGAVGAALLDSGVDACVFTGSVATGKKVAMRCAENMIPVSSELGGADPAIVLPDCDLPRTCAGITHWALHNAGQACGAVEVALVVDRIADDFVNRMASAFASLRARPGPFAEVDVSPLAHEGQLQTVLAHIDDAVKNGAKLVFGGAHQDLWMQPTLLDHCSPDLRVVQEETFGPLLAVVRVEGASEAVEIANSLPFGLTASVWSQDHVRAERLAERLNYGTVTVNNHSLTGAMTHLPWSGRRQSGFGIANSPEALNVLTHTKTVLVDNNQNPEPFWMPFDRDLFKLGDVLADAQAGKFLGATALPFLLRQRIKTIRDFFQEPGDTRS